MLTTSHQSQRRKALLSSLPPKTPPRKWSSRRLLSHQPSGDIKWSSATTRRHSTIATYYSDHIMRSPRGDVELASMRSKTGDKLVISNETLMAIRTVIQEELPISRANLAMILKRHEAVMDSFVNNLGLLQGLESLSLHSQDAINSEESNQYRKEYFEKLLDRVVIETGHNFKLMYSQTECEDWLSDIFIWDRMANSDDLLLPKVVTSDEEDTIEDPPSAPGREIATLPPITRRHPTTIDRKAVKAIARSTKYSATRSDRKTTTKKQTKPHLSLADYRTVIENKVGPSKWNQIFNRPHHSTLLKLSDTDLNKLTSRIHHIEESLTLKTDQLLSDFEIARQKLQATQRASSLLRPLTPDEQSIVRKALHSIGPDSDILASHDADSVQRSSLHRLLPGQWLNDEIINYFLKNCLAKRDEKMCAAQPGRRRSHFFNSYFVQTMFDDKNFDPSLRGRYAYKNVKRWSKKVPGGDIFNLKYIICPVNLDNVHWTSAVIFMEEKKIQYYDSLGGTDGSKLEGLFQYIKDEWKAKKGGEMDVSGWRLVGCTDDTPRQMNGYDCGVFTCMFSDFISQDCPLLFSQKHVNQCRERIALSILKNCAIE